MKVRIKDVVALAWLILMLAGLPNSIAGSSLLEGKLLHVWSYDVDSSYTAVHNVDKPLNRGNVYEIEQIVRAANYSGYAGVALLEVQVSDNGSTRWYSVYWYGENEVDVYGKSVQLDMSVPHTYKIEVTGNEIRFYIDGNLVNGVTGRKVTGIQQVNTGRWDEESTYDLYIDNVKEYWNGELTASEDFEDGRDDFYTSNVFRGRGDSGEEIISSKDVPEFPFLEPIVDKILDIWNKRIF